MVIQIKQREKVRERERARARESEREREREREKERERDGCLAHNGKLNEQGTVRPSPYLTLNKVTSRGTRPAGQR